MRGHFAYPHLASSSPFARLRREHIKIRGIFAVKLSAEPFFYTERLSKLSQDKSFVRTYLHMPIPKLCQRRVRDSVKDLGT